MNSFFRTFATSFMRPQISLMRVSILGFFLGLLVVFKYAFGFVPGVEAVTFFFVFFGLFLPWIDLTLLVICFNLLVIAMYGVGSWWVVYWIVWPIDAFGAKLLMRLTRSRFVIALWGFFAGFSILIYYFFSDIAFFDYSYAVLNIITAVPINLIEGLVTLALVIIIAPRLLPIVHHYMPRFWPRARMVTFRPLRHRRFSWVLTVTTALASVGGVATLFVYNNFFINLKQRAVQGQAVPGHITSRPQTNGVDLMSVNDYNATYDLLGPEQVAIVVLANGELTREVTRIYQNEPLYDAMQHLQTIQFRYFHHATFGYFVNSFRKLPSGAPPGPWQGGKATARNYDDYYPLYFVNNKFASLGVSSWLLDFRSVVEFSYDFQF